LIWVAALGILLSRLIIGYRCFPLAVQVMAVLIERAGEYCPRGGGSRDLLIVRPERGGGSRDLLIVRRCCVLRSRDLLIVRPERGLGGSGCRVEYPRTRWQDRCWVMEAVGSWRIMGTISATESLLTAGGQTSPLTALPSAVVWVVPGPHQAGATRGS
jgi:hypothetical protein